MWKQEKELQTSSLTKILEKHLSIKKSESYKKMKKHHLKQEYLLLKRTPL